MGVPNPRDYALPGNQDPHTPWPNSLMLLSAIASVTERLRLAASAVIAPLRHPLLLARELGTLDLLSEGRLIVLPNVSWSRDEYAALGVPCSRRGKLLDEHPKIWAKLWGPLSRVSQERVLLVHQMCGEVADVEELHDGSWRSADLPGVARDRPASPQGLNARESIRRRV